MRRTFGFDVLACPRCGGRLRLIALIEHASVIQRIVRHLGLPTEIPEPRPARAPPLPLAVRTRSVDDDATTVGPCSSARVASTRRRCACSRVRRTDLAVDHPSRLRSSARAQRDANTVDAGFACLPGLVADPALRALSGLPEFGRLRAEVERRHQRALAAFKAARGHDTLELSGEAERPRV